MKRYVKVWLLLCLAGSAAWADGRPGQVKVVLEGKPGHPARVEEVAARLGGERLKEYPAFTVIRVPEARRSEVGRAAAGAGLHATVQEEWDSVQMPGLAVDTRSPRLPSAGLLKGYPRGEGLYVIQFVAPLDAEWTQEIQDEGLRYISYLPYNAALVFGSQDGVARLAARPYVQWTSLYHPAFRAQPADLGSSQEVGRYLVQFVDEPGSEASIDTLQRESVRLENVVSYGPYVNVTVEVGPAILRTLIGDPYVVAIERAPVHALSGEREAIAATGTAVSTVEPYNNGVQPFKPAGDYKIWLQNRGLSFLPGQMIALADTGLSSGSGSTLHPDFQNQTILWKSYCGDATAPDNMGHGTAVTGLAAGNPTGSPADGPFHFGMGLAPGVHLYVQKIINNSGICTGAGSITSWATDAINARNSAGALSLVQTHSHNDYLATDGAYTAESQEYDTVVRDKRIPITVSAGNVCQGGLTPPCPSRVLPPATAKNVIAVGAAESYRPGRSSPCDHNTSSVRRPEDFYAASFKNVAYISRRGTADGRIKPEILAPATMASSTIRQNPLRPTCEKPDPLLDSFTGVNGLYSIDSGTSYAAPQVAGAAAAVSAKWWLNTLSPAMVKAILVSGATSVKGGVDRLTGATVAARPNAVQGFGRVSLAQILEGTPSQTVLDESYWAGFTGAGQSVTQTFTVHDTTRKSIAVLAWTDEPATVGAPKTLVRDLNLEVSVGSCTIYVGNKMTSTEVSQAGATCGSKLAADNTNNVEMVVIPAGATTFTVKVASATWGGTTPNQKFALYLYNGY